MPDGVIFISAQIEGLAGDEVVQGVVVEGGDVGGFPDLVLKTLAELVLQNVVVGSFQEGQDLLLFASGHNVEIEFLDVGGDDIREEAVLRGNDQIFSEMFVDEILLGLQHVHQLFELLYLHGLVYAFEFDKIQYLFVYYFEDKRDDAEYAIDQHHYFLFLLDRQLLAADLHDSFEEFADEGEAAGQEGAVHVCVVYEHLRAEEDVHLLH